LNDTNNISVFPFQAFKKNLPATSINRFKQQKQAVEDLVFNQ
jgi:hypothetical protein